MCKQLRFLFYYSRSVKFTLPLESNLISSLRYLFESCHRAFITIGQSLATYCADISKRFAYVPMVIATQKIRRPFWSPHRTHPLWNLWVQVVYFLDHFGHAWFYYHLSVPYAATTSRLFAVIIIATVTSCRYQTYGHRPQKSLSQNFDTCGCNCKCLEKNLNVADFIKVPSENLTCLSENGDVILTVLFQESCIIKNPVLLTLIPHHEFPSFRLTHLVHPKICNVRKWFYIVQICFVIQKSGYQDLVTGSPNASGSLRNGMGK